MQPPQRRRTDRAKALGYPISANGTIKRHLAKPLGAIRQRKCKALKGGCKSRCKGLRLNWLLGRKWGHFRGALHPLERKWVCIGVGGCPFCRCRSLRSLQKRQRGNPPPPMRICDRGFSRPPQKPPFLRPSAAKHASPRIGFCTIPLLGLCTPFAFNRPQGLRQEPFYMVLCAYRIAQSLSPVLSSFSGGGTTSHRTPSDFLE